MSMQTGISRALGGTPAAGDITILDVLAFRAINLDDDVAAKAEISTEIVARFGFTPVGPQLTSMFWLLVGAKEALL